MKLITAIVRPEKVMDVIKALEQEGYFAFQNGQFQEEVRKRNSGRGCPLSGNGKNMLYITVGDKEKMRL